MPNPPPYTGGHCKRVPVLATMLVEEACKAESGMLKGFSFSTIDEMDEFARGLGFMTAAR